MKPDDLSLDEKHKPSTLWEKSKDAPFVPIGILGTLGMIVYGVSQFKNRGNTSASIYIMQYRVMSQSVVVGAITLGVAYHMTKNYFYPEKKE